MIDNRTSAAAFDNQVTCCGASSSCKIRASGFMLAWINVYDYPPLQMQSVFAKKFKTQIAASPHATVRTRGRGGGRAA
jgi:hypothetical protein